MLTKLMKRLCLAAIMMMVCLSAHAGDDFDDISIDDSIDKYDSLDPPKDNINYIVRSAKASAADGNTVKGNGDVVIGSFINKPGAKVEDVTIIFENDEEITTISE